MYVSMDWITAEKKPGKTESLHESLNVERSYSWRGVCVRFRMDLHTGGVHLFMEGSLC